MSRRTPVSLDSSLLGIQFDRFQRLLALSRMVIKVVETGGRVLDVGGHPCELHDFLPDHFVAVADLPAHGSHRYVCADGPNLPFTDGSFDAVVSSDVLEHVPAVRRPAFIRELFRVSRRWVLLGLPRGEEDVYDAEVALDEFYSMLHGTAHPWLAEHFANGVPTPAQVEDLLREHAAAFTRFPNGYLPRWGAAMLVNRYLESDEQADLRLARFNVAYNLAYAECDAKAPAYRDIYVASKDHGQPPEEAPPASKDPGFDQLWEAFLASAEGADLGLPLRPSVTVVIVTYHHEDSVGACVRSLRCSVGVTPEIIVVDNGSADRSAEIAHEAGAVVVRAGRNLGFAAAFNLGWRVGRGEIVVSVNPDVVVEPDALSELTQSCLEDEKVAVVGATLREPEGATILHAGGEILANFCTRHLGRGLDLAPACPRQVDYVTGALMAVKRRVLETLGGLDEGYWPAYYEETDLCARVRECGLRVTCWPWAQARHRESSTLGPQTEAFFRAYHRGRLRFVGSHLPVRTVGKFLRAECAFRAGRRRDDIEMAGLRRGWRGWWWRIPLAMGVRAAKGWMKWRRS